MAYGFFGGFLNRQRKLEMDHGELRGILNFQFGVCLIFFKMTGYFRQLLESAEGSYWNHMEKIKAIPAPSHFLAALNCASYCLILQHELKKLCILF